MGELKLYKMLLKQSLLNRCGVHYVIIYIKIKKFKVLFILLKEKYFFSEKLKAKKSKSIINNSLQSNLKISRN